MYSRTECIIAAVICFSIAAMFFSLAKRGRRYFRDTACRVFAGIMVFFGLLFVGVTLFPNPGML